jgi:hypothetical protein
LSVLSKSRCKSDRLLHWLYWSLVSTVVGQIWMVQFFPTQDGPMHAYNGWLLAHLLLKNPSGVTAAYRLNLYALTNCASTVLLAALCLIVRSSVACKVVSSVGVVGLALAAWTENARREDGQYLLPFLILPLALSKFLFFGFYNFSLSLPLAILIIAGAARYQIFPSRGAAGRLAILFVLIALCHPAVYCAMMIVVVSLAIMGLPARPFQWRLSLFLIGSPSIGGIIVLPFFLLHPVRDAAIVGLPQVTSGLLNLILSLPLRSLTLIDNQLALAWSCVVVAVGIFAYSSGKWGKLAVAYSVAFVLLTTMLAVIPDSLAGGGAVSLRLSVLAYIALVLVVSEINTSYWADRLSIAAASVYVAVFIACHFTYLNDMSRETAHYVDTVMLVHPKGPVLSLCFNQQGNGYPGEATNYQPLLHIAGYVDTDLGIVDYNNVEADLGYFPVEFTQSPNPLTLLGGRALVEERPQATRIVDNSLSDHQRPVTIVLSGVAEWRNLHSAGPIPLSWFRDYEQIGESEDGATVALARRHELPK